MIRVPRSATTVVAALSLLAVLAAPGGTRAQESAATGEQAAALLDVPFLPQTELLCGGAAAAMVLRYWGSRDVTAEAFRPLVRPAEGGIRGGELAREVRGRGWRSISFRGDPAEVRRQVTRGRPVIALLEVGPDRRHFVVVVAWTEDGVVYHDPAEGPFRVRSREAFEAAWEPTGRWTLLVLPSGKGAAGPAEDDGSAPAPGSGQQTDDPDLVETPCGERIREGVRRARAGDLGAADELLGEATTRCPSSARARAELAGVRARQERWGEARELAAEATRLDPADPHPWRTLATARFLTGDHSGALAAWNRVDEPPIARIRVTGMSRTPERVVHRRLGLKLDRVLSRESLTRAVRRLELLPAAYSTRVDYRPAPGGGAEVDAAVLERPLVPATPAEWAGIAIRAAALREVSVSSAAAAGAGERWTGSARIHERRPLASLRLAVPDPPLLPGVAELTVAWERQSYGLEDGVTTEQRRRVGLGVSDWITGRLRAGIGAALDRWSEVAGTSSGRVDGSVRGALELRTLSDRLSVRAEGSGATALAGSSGTRYATGGLRLAWRSSGERSGPAARLRLGVEGATADAPLAAWPGAGTGRARDGLLRAHPLLEDGVVRGPGFGRALVHGGVEGVWWLGLPVPVAVGVSTFADLARPWLVPGSRTGRLEIDAGAGLRLGVPGGTGTLHVAVAEGLRSGGSRLHVGWEAPWPGVDRRRP